MMLALERDGLLVTASPELREAGCACPHCGLPVIAHCGTLVSWHWAHRAGDCDPWAEPESEWHLAWKRALIADRGAQVEVSASVNGEKHRADAVLPSGTVVELQHDYLSVEEIAARERFWQAAGHRVVWLYDGARFAERLHAGPRGFWWKHGSKAMATHRCALYWHYEHEIIRVRLHVKRRGESRRVLGSVVGRWQVSDVCPSRAENGSGRAT